MAVTEVGISLDFIGEGDKDRAVVAACTLPEYQLPVGTEVVAVDPKYFRPTEVELLLGDPSKANKKLGWQPKYDLPALVKEMVQSDLDTFHRKGLQQYEHTL